MHFLSRKLNDLEQRAEELDGRRTEKSSISSVSFINNRNRKNNVLKAEKAIQVGRKVSSRTMFLEFFHRR